MDLKDMCTFCSNQINGHIWEALGQVGSKLVLSRVILVFVSEVFWGFPIISWIVCNKYMKLTPFCFDIT